MQGRRKKLGLTVKAELKSDKGEQVATHTHDFSLDYPMPLLASSILINKSKIYPVLWYFQESSILSHPRSSLHHSKDSLHGLITLSSYRLHSLHRPH